MTLEFKSLKYTLTDHICRHCGQGRILRIILPPKTCTTGGNPIFYCSTCKETSCSITTSGLCWCGAQYIRGGPDGVPYNTMCCTEEMANQMKEHGWHIKEQNYDMFIMWKQAKDD